MNIGDFARLGPASPRMLRHYDQLGILQPDHIDPVNNYRSYGVGQLARLHRILALRDLGFSLDEITKVLHDNPSVEELRGMLRLRRSEIELHISQENERLQRVEAHLHTIERNTTMSTANVVIKQSQPLRVAEMVSVAEGGGFTNVGPVFQTLIPKVLERLGQAGIRPGISIGAYEDPQEDGSLPVHVGFEISDQELEGDDELHIVDYPSREVASMVNHGSITEISSWYEDLYRWVENSGRAPTANPIELYLAWDENDMSKNVTEIQVPLT